MLINNNYELIIALFEDHVYIKITNLINYASFESNIYSYDITHENVKTIKNFWNILSKGFQIMDTYNVNILDPDIKIFNGAEYIILKLLEQCDNIVLTIYYNFVMCFDFNVTLKKIKSDNSNCDLTKMKYELERKDKQIKELQKGYAELLNRVDFLFSSVDIRTNYGSWKLDTEELDLVNIEGNSCNDLSKLYKLKKLKIYSVLQSQVGSQYIFKQKNLPNILTLEELTICSNNYHYSNGTFAYHDLSGFPNLKRLEFNRCHRLVKTDIEFSNNNAPYIEPKSVEGTELTIKLLNSIRQHPNKNNIDLVLSNNICQSNDTKQGYFLTELDNFHSLGLKSVTVV